jgi:putative glutamine amidotransferase
MALPLIGITTYGRDEDGSFSLPGVYIDAVRRAGGVPFLVPPGETNWSPLLAIIDGWILTGGGDMDPGAYGGEGHETMYMVDSERDSSEFELVRHIVDSSAPIFGICRGVQVLNVVMGGDLHAHLPDVVGDQIAHRAPPRQPIPHRVTLKPGTKLAAIVKELEFEAASWHHQGIRKVASALEVVAHAPDGVIEAVEMAAHPWLIGVQWHPELTAARDPIQQRLFDAFVEFASGKRKRGILAGDGR